MGMQEFISEFKKRQMINRMADMALKKITKRHLVKAFRKAAADKVFADGDILHVSYTINVQGQFTGKAKRLKK